MTDSTLPMPNGKRLTPQFHAPSLRCRSPVPPYLPPPPFFRLGVVVKCYCCIECRRRQQIRRRREECEGISPVILVGITHTWLDIVADRSRFQLTDHPRQHTWLDIVAFGYLLFVEVGTRSKPSALMDRDERIIFPVPHFLSASTSVGVQDTDRHQPTAAVFAAQAPREGRFGGDSARRLAVNVSTGVEEEGGVYASKRWTLLCVTPLAERHTHVSWWDITLTCVLRFRCHTMRVIT